MPSPRQGLCRNSGSSLQSHAGYADVSVVVECCDTASTRSINLSFRQMYGSSRTMPSERLPNSLSARGRYYGIDYGQRAIDGVPEDEKPSHFVPDGSYPANDLSWYANIPVPTSYMIANSKGDFAGGVRSCGGGGDGVCGQSPHRSRKKAMDMGQS